MNRGTKIKPLQGADGYLYFNYKVGSYYRIKEKISGKIVTLSVIRATLYSDTEYYTVLLDYSQYKWTANRLRYVLHFQCLEKLDEGTAVRYPLLSDEVKSYYNAKRSELSKARQAAERQLAETNFRAIEKRLEALWIGRGVSYEEREHQERELLEERARIINELNIDPRVLATEPECECCKDTGFTKYNQICSCANRRSDIIQNYCAKRRIQRVSP